MATGSLSDTTQIYPGWCAFPLWNDRKLFKEEEALRHQSYLLLKLSLGLPFEDGIFNPILGLSAYLNYGPPA